MLAPCIGVGSGKVFALDQHEDLIKTAADALIVVADLKGRKYGLIEDSGRSNVGNCAFERSVDIKAGASVVDGDDKEQTVADILAAELPVVSDPMGVVFDRFSVERRYDNDTDLGAVSSLKVVEFRLQRSLLLCGKNTCAVSNVRHLRYRQ